MLDDHFARNQRSPAFDEQDKQLHGKTLELDGLTLAKQFVLPRVKLKFPKADKGTWHRRYISNFMPWRCGRLHDYIFSHLRSCYVAFGALASWYPHSSATAPQFCSLLYNL